MAAAKAEIRYSTETAITAFHDELVRNIDSGKVSVLELLDLSTTFIDSLARQHGLGLD